MRIVLAALALVLIAGCSSRQPAAAGGPDGLLIAFADGFHSGVVVARGSAPPELLPEGDPRPWVAFHFGERGFITGESAGAGDALRLGLVGGGGGMQVDMLDWWVHDRGGTDPARVRIWVFVVPAAALAGVRERLRSWVAPGAQSAALRPGTLWWPSTRRWWLGDNCHDFTLDILRSGGLGLPWRPLRLASSVRADLDAAWAARDAP